MFVTVQKEWWWCVCSKWYREKNIKTTLSCFLSLSLHGIKICEADIVICAHCLIDKDMTRESSIKMKNEKAIGSSWLVSLKIGSIKSQLFISCKTGVNYIFHSIESVSHAFNLSSFFNCIVNWVWLLLFLDKTYVFLVFRNWLQVWAK